MEHSIHGSNGSTVDHDNVRIGRDYISHADSPLNYKMHMVMHAVQTLIMVAMLAVLSAIVVFLKEHDDNVASINEHTSVISKLETEEEKAFFLSYLFELHGKERADGSDCTVLEDYKHSPACNGAGSSNHDIHRNFQRGAADRATPR